MFPIGRDAELALVADRLRDRRLVTVVGPGGIGKTTLARAAATATAGDYGEGVVHVDLTRIDTVDGLNESIATQLGYGSFAALLDAPGDRSILVLLDNCEHVVDAAAEAVELLLEACQMPTFLATSRTPLELPGETIVPLGPLALPPTGSIDAPSVRLFLERAADAGVVLEPSDAVAELCRQLDGVPLAIELAAARTSSLSPSEILQRLDADLGVLDRPRRRSVARHRSLSAAVDWSYELLGEPERRAFTRLSVVPGPFTASFAHAVAGDDAAEMADTQDLLGALVAASMLVAEPPPASGPTTYRMLETLRTYGREQLAGAGLVEAVEARFVGHVAALIAGVVADGARGWAASALNDLLALYDSTAAALRWCLAHDEPDHAMLMGAALWGVIHQAHTEEIGDLAEQILLRWPDTTNPLLADVAATAATCRYMLGDDDSAIRLATEMLDAAERSPYTGATLRRAIAQAQRASGDAEAALECFAATRDAARTLGLAAMAIEAESARAQILADLSRIDDALSTIADARHAAEAADLELSTAWTCAIEGSILLRVDPVQATGVLEQALKASDAIGYHAGSDATRRALALASLLAGDLGAAAGHVSRLLEQLLSRGSTNELRTVFDVAAAILERAGRIEAGRDLAATALAMPVVSITASVGHELFPIDAEGGRLLTPRQAILLARTELGDLAHREDGPPADASHAADDRVGVLRRAGELWEVGFGGDIVTVKHTKGLDDLARLVREAGREVHCLELIGAGVDESGTGPQLDDTARRAYEGRVRELQAEVDEADDANDRGRADRARLELDALVDQLTEALGLRGRARSTGSSAERARSAVTQRIRSTIRRLDQYHPRLARHLQASIRTGTFASYDPESPVRWQL